MAILGKIRNQGVILILVIALALFAFIIQGVLTSNGQKQSEAIGYVGDIEIGREEFARKVENASRNRGADFSQLQAVNQVWDQEVRDAILEQQIKAAGIDLTDEKIVELVKANYKSNPQFQNEDGSFSESKFSAFVNTINPKIWGDYIKGTTLQAKQDQFFNLVKSGLIATNADGELDYRMENDKRSFTFVNIPYTTIPDSLVEVSKSEIDAYISKHKSQFKVEAQRDIEFVLFEDKASSTDVDAFKQDLNKMLTAQTQRNLTTKEDYTIPAITDAKDLEAYVAINNSDLPYDNSYMLTSKLSESMKPLAALETGQTYGPYMDGEFMKLSIVENKKIINDSVQNRHILVAYAGAERADPSITRDREAAFKVTDSILKVIGQSKEKFDENFKYYQENKEVANGQDIGWVIYSGNAKNYAPEFTEFLFSNDKGSIGMTESDFGYHIIRIDDATAPTEAIKIATVARKVIPSKQTGKDLFTQAIKFQKAAKTEDFKTIANQNNVTLTPVTNLKQLDETLPVIGKNRSIVQWAFNESRSLGDIERFETSKGYVIAKLVRKSKEGNMSSVQASAKVTPILRKDKKAKMIIGKITASDINEIAANQGQNARAASQLTRNSPTIGGIGEEPFVVGTAFGLEQGVTSKPIIGDNGVFVIKVTAIENAPDLQNYASNANNLATQAANQSTNQLVEALKKSAKIEDKRAEFY